VTRRIVAMGGATLRPEDYDPRLNAFVLSLARRGRPRVCFVGTASGDSPEYVANFYHAFSGHHDCEPSDLGLFERTVADLRAFVLAQDVVYVGGGNTASLLAVWRMHGLDVVLREAWGEEVGRTAAAATVLPRGLYESPGQDGGRIPASNPLLPSHS
jgi:peptidase E